MTTGHWKAASITKDGVKKIMELYEELDLKNRQLSQSLKELRKNGNALAKAEKEYKEMVSKEALRLRNEEMPVTLIEKVIYGLPSVSTLRFERDIADVLYKANQEAINITKLQVRIIENQLGREWSNEKDN